MMCPKMSGNVGKSSINAGFKRCLVTINKSEAPIIFNPVTKSLCRSIIISLLTTFILNIIPKTIDKTIKIKTEFPKTAEKKITAAIIGNDRMILQR